MNQDNVYIVIYCPDGDAFTFLPLNLYDEMLDSATDESKIKTVINNFFDGYFKGSVFIASAEGARLFTDVTPLILIDGKNSRYIYKYDSENEKILTVFKDLKPESASEAIEKENNANIQWLMDKVKARKARREKLRYKNKLEAFL
jgi:hypothetical protein